jgi:hypothetical protein
MRFFRLPSDRNWLVLVALFVLGTGVYFSLRNSNGYRGGVLDLDGYYYYVYLRSLQMDHDINFGNEYEEWGNTFGFGPTDTGHHRNVFGVGPAILWAPFFLLACGLARLGAALGFPLSLDGFSPFHQTVTLFGTLIYGWIALLLCYRVARETFGREHALWGTLGAALAGPLPYYCFSGAFPSHAMATMATSLLVLLWILWRDGWTRRRWLWFGASAGLVVLVRPACAPFLLLPLLEAARTLLAAVRARQRSSVARELLRAAVGPALAAAAVALVFFPQLLCWKILYGRWLLVPQGEGFMRWDQNAWASTLFAPRNGLFTVAPLLLFALVGLFLALRRLPALAGPLLLTLAGVLVVNGAAYDWWGWGFSSRRFTEVLPLFTFGLAACLRATRERLARNPGRAIARGTALVVLLFVLFNLQWMVSFATRGLDWYHVRSTEGLYMSVVHGMMDRVYRSVGNPLSAPLTIPFALRRGGSPRTYDRIDGSWLLGQTHLGANPAGTPFVDATVVFSDLRFRHNLSDSFGYPLERGGIQYAPLREPRGHVFLPLNRPGDVQVTVGGRAVHPGTRVEVRFNGELLGTRELPDRDWTLLDFRAPGRIVERGINRLDLIHHLPPLPEPERCLPSALSASPPRTSPGQRRCCRADVAALSGGTEAGNFAEIWVNEERVAPSWRGLNVAVVDPDSGRLLDVRGFDHIAYRAAYHQLAQHLRHFPKGSVVAFAIRGEATRSFERGGREALALFGATGRALVKDDGFAALGVLGAAPGSALEASSHKDHARVHIGRVPPPWRELAQYRILRLR